MYLSGEVCNLVFRGESEGKRKWKRKGKRIRKKRKEKKRRGTGGFVLSSRRWQNQSRSLDAGEPCAMALKPPHGQGGKGPDSRRAWSLALP